MNRRSIFKLFASATLAAAVEVAGLAPGVKKIVTHVMVNPDYLAAEYETLVFWDTVKHGGIADPSGVALVPGHLRPRYNFIDGKYVEVPYYKTYEEEVPT